MKWAGTSNQQLKFQAFAHDLTLLLSTDMGSLDFRIGEHGEPPLRLPASREGAACHFPPAPPSGPVLLTSSPGGKSLSSPLLGKGRSEDKLGR